MPYSITVTGFFTVELEEVDDLHVQVVTIEHQHGQDTEVFDSAEAANEYLYRWVKEYWEKDMDGDLSNFDPDVAVVIYFSHRDGETYYSGVAKIRSKVDVEAGL